MKVEDKVTKLQMFFYDSELKTMEGSHFKD